MAELKTKPDIRYVEFIDAWEQRKLGILAEFSKGLGYSKGDLTESGTPIILYGRLYTKYETVISKVDTFAVEKEKSVFSKGNEVIVPASGETAEEISRASVVKHTGIILGGDLNILRPKSEICSVFLALSISNDAQQKELSKKAQGKSVVHIHNSDLKEILLAYPKLDEQKKIGTLFSNLDHLITLRQREYDKTVNIKKAMLEKMFPKEGADKPEIRFAGFTDAWEQRKLGTISERVIVGLATSVTPYYRDSGIPILRNLNIKPNYLDDSDVLHLEESYADSQKSKQIHTDDVLTVHTGYIGISCVVPEKYDNCLTFTTLITTPKKNVLDSGYLVQFLNSDTGMSMVQAVTTQGGRQNLNTNDFIKVAISFPCLCEQSKISTFLSHLDHLITLHQRELIKLQNMKKALLEKMFV